MTPNDKSYLAIEDILDKAHTAAKAAYKKAEDEADTWFPCGFAWVTIKANTQMARHCKNACAPTDPTRVSQEYFYGAKGYPKGWAWWCPGHGATQRLETYKASANAFAAVLKEHGIDATVRSRMD